MYKLDRGRLDDFLVALCRGREVFALQKDSSTGADGGDQYHLVNSDGWRPDLHTLGSFRPVEPLKSLVFPPREFLGSLTGGSRPRPEVDRIVVGVKNCDLSALEIHDHVNLKTAPVDPFYAEARSKTFIVSSDCTDARDVCFCPVVDEQPYAKKGFDVNISPTSEGYVVEVGSEKAEKELAEMRHYLSPADDAIVKERDEKRAEMTRRVREQAESAS